MGGARAWYEHSDERPFRALLRVRRQRPRRRRAAEQSDELAPIHVHLSAGVLKTTPALEEMSRCAVQQIQATYVGSGSKADVTRCPLSAKSKRCRPENLTKNQTNPSV